MHVEHKFCLPPYSGKFTCGGFTQLPPALLLYISAELEENVVYRGWNEYCALSFTTCTTRSWKTIKEITRIMVFAARSHIVCATYQNLACSICFRKGEGCVTSYSVIVRFVVGIGPHWCTWWAGPIFSLRPLESRAPSCFGTTPTRKDILKGLTLVLIAVIGVLTCLISRSVTLSRLQELEALCEIISPFWKMQGQWGF